MTQQDKIANEFNEEAELTCEELYDDDRVEAVEEEGDK